MSRVCFRFSKTLSKLKMAYEAILHNLQASISNEKKKVDEARRRSDYDFLQEVQCSKDVLTAIDSLYVAAKNDYDEKIRTLDSTFSTVRRSRDAYVHRLRKGIIEAENGFQDAVDTLRKVKTMPLLDTSVEKSCEEQVEKAKARKDRLVDSLKFHDALEVPPTLAEVPPTLVEVPPTLTVPPIVPPTLPNTGVVVRPPSFFAGSNELMPTTRLRKPLTPRDLLFDVAPKVPPIDEIWNSTVAAAAVEAAASSSSSSSSTQSSYRHMF